ncbi:MAG: response regulator transcription factor [Verrucomicrobia bacterium]|nr:response regulator transcription factor [Verrucomicrobiota bacterium]
MAKRKLTGEPLTRKKILVVDDHAVLREGLVAQINREPNLVVCGEAEDAREALSSIGKLKPDLVLVDITLPGRNGLELIRDIRALHPHLPVLVLSMHDESLFAERVLRAGGRGYVSKRQSGQRLIEGIRRVLNGKVYVSEEVSTKLFDALSGRQSPKTVSPVEQLTDRELEVFTLIGQAKETKEISRRLGMSVKTVEAHRASIKRKLKLKTGPELTRHAVLWVEAVK